MGEWTSEAVSRYESGLGVPLDSLAEGDVQMGETLFSQALDLGWSKHDLARKLGVSFNTITKWMILSELRSDVADELDNLIRSAKAMPKTNRVIVDVITPTDNREPFIRISWEHIKLPPGKSPKQTRLELDDLDHLLDELDRAKKTLLLVSGARNLLGPANEEACARASATERDWAREEGACYDAPDAL